MQVFLHCFMQVFLHCFMQVFLHCFMQVFLHCFMQVFLHCFMQVFLHCFMQRGRVDDLSFFEYLSPFVFCQLNFIVLFPFLIKYYHILFINIVFWLGCDRPSGHLFFRALFAFFHTHASLFTSFVCFFILFHSRCSHAQVFGKTLVHEFPISYSHTEWYLLFSLCEGNE